MARTLTRNSALGTDSRSYSAGRFWLKAILGRLGDLMAEREATNESTARASPLLVVLVVIAVQTIAPTQQPKRCKLRRKVR